jgi:2-polyprenyl-3-methyl-5-hydroxy-6-metoxy-1,4-benzoquinol methylase
MTSAQSDYFDVKSHQFPVSTIKKPLLSQLLEMEHLKQSLALPNGSKIMDFGCGSGRLSMFFLSQGYHVTAVDISPKSLANLQNTYRQLRLPGWGKLTTSSILPQTAFDGVVGSDILHHVQITNILPKLFKLLKPGGKIAFSEPNALNLFWYFHYFIQGVPWKIESGILQNTSGNLKHALKNSQFTKINIYRHGLFPTKLFNFSSSLCEFNCSKLGNFIFLRSLSYRLIISAQK